MRLESPEIGFQQPKYSLSVEMLTFAAFKRIIRLFCRCTKRRASATCCSTRRRCLREPYGIMAQPMRGLLEKFSAMKNPAQRGPGLSHSQGCAQRERLNRTLGRRQNLRVTK